MFAIILTRLPVEQSRPLGDHLADRRIACGALGRLAGEHRDVAVDVVIDDHFPLGVMKPVKTTGILRQGSPPGDRHGEEERVQALVVKALPGVATGRHDHPLVLLGVRRKALHRLSPLPLTLAAPRSLRSGLQPPCLRFATAVTGRHARLGTRLLARLCRGRHLRRQTSTRLQGATLVEPDLRLSLRIRLSRRHGKFRRPHPTETEPANGHPCEHKLLKGPRSPNVPRRATTASGAPRSPRPRAPWATATTTSPLPGAYPDYPAPVVLIGEGC